SITVPPSVVPLVRSRAALNDPCQYVTPKNVVPTNTGCVLGTAKTSMSEPSVDPSTAPPSVTSNRRTGLDQAANAASMLACAEGTSSGAVSPVTAKVSSSAAVSSIATLMCTTLPSGPATAFQRSAFCGASPGVNGTKARAALASGPAAQRRAVVQ